MARRRPKYRTLRRTEQNSDYKILLRRVRKEAAFVNTRLKRIRDKSTFATGYLKMRSKNPKLKVWKNNRIMLPKNATKNDLEMIENSLIQFLKNPTSSARGINAAMKNVEKGISNLTGKSDDVVKKLVSFTKDKNFKSLYEKIDSSEALVIMGEAIEKEDSKEEFMERIKVYIDYGNDEDMKGVLNKIYKDYVS